VELPERTRQSNNVIDPDRQTAFLDRVRQWITYLSDE
jgi:hypothetical protein